MRADKNKYLNVIIYIFIFALNLCLIFLFADPVIDQDSQRYVPISPLLSCSVIPSHGAALPIIINFIPNKYFGLHGIIFLNCAVYSYALARLVQTLSINLFPLIFSGLFILYFSVFSLAPFVLTVIVSEPISMSVIILLSAIVYSRRITWIDCIFILIFSAYHPSNLFVIVCSLLIFSIISYLTFRCGNFRFVSKLIILCLFSSLLDKFTYNYFCPYKPRIYSQFFAASLINYYPFILEEVCKEDDSLVFCKKDVREFIEQNRKPALYQPGQFLWGNTALRMIIPSRALLERDSSKLILASFKIIPAHILKFSQISASKIAALFSARKLYLCGFTKTCGTSGDINMKYHTYYYKLINSKLFYGISEIIIVGQIIILFFLLLIYSFRVYMPHKNIISLIIFVLAFYLINLIFMGIVGTAVSRYHYKAFPLISILNFVIISLLVRQSFRYRLRD